MSFFDTSWQDFYSKQIPLLERKLEEATADEKATLEQKLQYAKYMCSFFEPLSLNEMEEVL